MPLEIRLIKDSEYEAVNDFFNRPDNLQRNKLLAERSYNDFSWEFIKRPNGKAIYAIAIDVEEGKEPAIVGIQCVIPFKMTSSTGQRFLAGKGEDTLIDLRASIKYKNIDILKELSSLLDESCKKNGFEFLWGFNNLPATNKRLGYENPFKTTDAVLILNPIQAFKHTIVIKAGLSFFGKLRTAILTGGAYLYSLKRILVFCGKSSYKINFNLDENEDLFRRIDYQDEIYFSLQDDAYLKWRIAENPYPVSYKSYQLIDQEGIMKAQVICSINKNVAFIDQLLIDKKLSSKTVHYLLRKVIRSLKSEGACLVRYIGFQNNALKVKEINKLKKSGFVFTGKGEQFTFKKLVDDSLITPENIYLSRMYKQGVN